MEFLQEHEVAVWVLSSNGDTLRFAGRCVICEDGMLILHDAKSNRVLGFPLQQISNLEVVSYGK